MEMRKTRNSHYFRDVFLMVADLTSFSSLAPAWLKYIRNAIWSSLSPNEPKQLASLNDPELQPSLA